MHTHPFPDTEPEVTVTPRPDATLTEVLRTDAGGFFVPLEVGGEAMWSFYDWPERKLTNVCRTRALGTVLYRGEELLEIVDQVIWPPEDAGESTRWFYRLKDETMTWVLREMRWPGRPVKISEADVTPDPLRMRVGLTWEGHELYRCGEEVEGEGQVNRSVIDGPFEVTLPSGPVLALRETLSIFAPDGRGSSFGEIYVADTGRTVYFRRFNGPAWRNYNALDAAGVPAREHEGVTWRLWYECLPEHAL